VEATKVTKKDRTKRRVEEVFATAASRRAQTASGCLNPTPAESLLSQVEAVGPIVRAFEEAGLNFEDPLDWIRLATYLAAAVYGKEPGQPATWTIKKYEALLSDISEIRSATPEFSEIESCRVLLKKKGGVYNEVSKASTLRRILQDAKGVVDHWQSFSDYVEQNNLDIIHFLKRERKRRRRGSAGEA
jgi:hypothetical protein